jgi:hypothetical protein
MLAGGIGGGMFGIGCGILGVVLTFGVVVLALGFVFGTLLGGDFTGGLGTIIVVLLLVGLIVGILLVVLAVVISQRILRRGGVNRPVAVTWLSLLVVLVVNTIAQRLADPILTQFGDTEVPGWAPVVVSIGLGLLAIGVGIGAWLLMANLFRGSVRTAPTPPVAPGVFPPDTATAAAPASQPAVSAEPPASTVTNPPPAPPPPTA